MLFASSRMALHPSENGLAVALSPLSGGSAVGLMPLEDPLPSLTAASRMRWLDVGDDAKVSCVEWSDDLLFVGTSRGRVLVADAPVSTCADGSGILSPSGALMTAVDQPAVAEVMVSPHAPAASTLVRMVRVNQSAQKSRVLGLKDDTAYLWDLGAGPLPVQQWAPHRQRDAPAPLLFAEWAPGSAAVVLSGSYDGDVVLVDTRCATDGNSLSFGLKSYLSAPCAALSGDFNRLLPFLFATSFSNGAMAIFDVRYPVQALQTLSTLQGDAVCVRWWRQNADLLSSAGSDGSVALWCLRSPPSFCIGRAQYDLPVTDLIMTETYAEQRALGCTMGGAITMTGLQKEALMSMAPTLSYSGVEDGTATATTAASAAAAAVASIDPAEEESYRKEEQTACGYLYTRQLKEAYSLLSSCADRRLAMKQTAVVMQLISHIDVVLVPPFDAAALIREIHEAAEEVSSLTDALQSLGYAYETMRDQLEMSLLRCSERLCTTLHLDRIRALSTPNSDDLQKLEAVRLNVLLHRVLESDKVDEMLAGVRKALDLIVTHPRIAELIDIGVVQSIVKLLLKTSFSEGEKFVQLLLTQLSSSSTIGRMSLPLLRAVLSATQEPSVTMGLQTRVARRFVERFYKDMESAKDAVLTQLHIQRLGVEHYREVITIVNGYQERCIDANLPGMFGWVALKPLLLFLHCLTADSNYVTFFWASVQYIEAFALFPGVREVEQVLFAVVDRIHAAAVKTVDNLRSIADLTRFSIPLLRQASQTLTTTHDFIVVLIRVQLECENVAIARHMPTLPPAMEMIQGVLNTASEDVLDAWAGSIDALIDCGQVEMVRKYCMAAVRDFSMSIEDLMDVSSKGDADERLNEILDVCDDFFNEFGRRRAAEK